MTILIIIFICILGNNTLDDIWNYGFSYNIAKGAIPYKDFNMVVMPLYSLLMSVPLILFGNKLIIFHIANTILFSTILYFTSSQKKLANILLMYFPYFIHLSLISSYNTFIGLLFISILYIEKSSFKYKNEIIGILLGCILATKQNIGIVLFIPYIFHSKEKLKSTIYYLIPIAVICIYLIFNNALYECIDYCFLGLSNFKDNFIIRTPIVFLIGIFICCFLILKYKRTKDINYVYILFFQFINYPLFDVVHFTIGIMPVFYYIKFDRFNKFMSLFLICTISGLIIISCLMTIHNRNNINKEEGVYKYTTVMYNFLNDMEKFIRKNRNKKIFIFTPNAYVIKIYMNQKLDKYDLINKGNMGKYENKYIYEIDDICKNKKCAFIMNEKEFDIKYSQLNKIIREYIKKNYKKCNSESIDYFCN